MFISRLQFYNIFVSPLFEILFWVKSFFGSLVKCLKVRDIRLLLHKFWEIIVKLCNEHSKLSTPVANVVGSNYIVAQEFKNTTDTVALNSAA